MEAAATRHADKIETSSVNQKGRRATLTFNSYCETLEARQQRPRRSMITRPALNEV
jgi:hypothetical protein